MIMKKFLAALALLLMGLPAGAATKPTDMVNVMVFEGHGTSEEDLKIKKYSKAWGSLVLDQSTRQKILAKERKLEADHFDKFRIYAIRIQSGNGKSVVSDILFLSPYIMVGWQFLGADNCVSIDLGTNGTFPSMCD
jgi:hypothetical protein